MLISFGITTLGGIFIYLAKPGDTIYNIFYSLIYVAFPFQYLWVPLLYVFTLSFAIPTFKIKKSYLLHIIPFSLIIIRVVILLISENPENIRKITTTDFLFNPVERTMYYILEYLQFYFYAIASLMVLRRYHIHIKEFHSSIEKINLSWLAYIIYSIILVKTLKLIGTIFSLMSILTNVYIYIYIAIGIIFVFFLGIIFLKGIYQPNVFFVLNNERERGKYSKTKLSDELQGKYFSMLINHMDINKPYLDPDLNLNILSNQVQIPTHHLSQIINSKSGQNFYDFINSYRIKESIELLKNDRKKTILEILYETGFNSKSVFNTFFKKYTKMTPTEFRRTSS
ncbi:MAG: AraC family transcriptional regulator [Bacteroidales bacterium]|nr:AraC family transcriptional regulator [Bacteroidales bacterium]